jgi:hypothetical protein
MIRHVVVVTLAEGAAEERVAEGVAALAALDQAIPQIRALSVGRGTTASGEPSRTIGLVVDVASRDDLAAYNQHPAHRAAGAKLAEVMTSAAVADVELD